MDDERLDKIAFETRLYFSHVRDRLDNVEWMHDATHDRRLDVEKWIVITATLEAVAKRWCALFDEKRAHVAMHVCAFLVRYASPVFDRCSAPDLLRRASEHFPALVPALESVLKFHSHPAIVRDWRADPTVNDLLSAPEVESAIATATAPRGTWALWFAESRYGEMLYRYCRTGWVHLLGAHPGLRNGSGYRTAEDERPDEPDYENMTRRAVEHEPFKHERDPLYRWESDGADDLDGEGFYTKKTLRLSLPYLLGEVRRAVDGFETECVNARLNPVPDEWREPE